MGLEIHTTEEQNANAHIIADRRLYLDETKEIVLEEGDSDAAFLLIHTGQAIPKSEVKRLGLKLADGKVVQGDVEAPKAKTPSENKERKPGENKGAKKETK